MLKNLLLITLVFFSFSQELKSKSFGIDIGVIEESFSYYYDNDYFQLTAKSSANVIVSSNLQFHLSDFLSIQAKFSYLTRSLTFNANENYTVTDDDNDFFIERENSLTELRIGINALIYFSSFEEQSVRPYIIGGISKQMSFIDSKYKSTRDNDDNLYESNDEEYFEDLNSPISINLGIGAEYFFNSSLSLTANFIMVYESASGTYSRKRYYLDNNDNRILYAESDNELSTSLIRNRTTIGLNFYF